MNGAEFEDFVQRVLAPAFVAAISELSERKDLFAESIPSRDGYQLTFARLDASELPQPPFPSISLKDQPGQPTIILEEFDPGASHRVSELDPSTLTAQAIKEILLAFVDRSLWREATSVQSKLAHLLASFQDRRLTLLDQHRVLTEAGFDPNIARVLLMDLHRSGKVNFEPNLVIPEDAAFNWTSGEIYLDGNAGTSRIKPSIDGPHFFEEICNQLNRQDHFLTRGEEQQLSADVAEKQGPAAYRFRLQAGKIDVLPEPPEPLDHEFTIDTYDALLGKARELLARLQGSNSARRVYDSVDRLLVALGSNFEDLRPGVLLSRVRSIETDRAAFDSEEARHELFPEALAVIDDVLQSARDLMAAFPLIRRIEAERLALDLDGRAEAIPILRDRIDEIKSAAEQSGAATEHAIAALAQNDQPIEAAMDRVLRTSLIADQLLVVRNFLGVLAGALERAKGELGDVGAQSWAAIKAELPKGVGLAARVAPFFGLVTLTGWLAGPAVGIASVVPGFKALATAFKDLTKN